MAAFFVESARRDCRASWMSSQTLRLHLFCLITPVVFHAWVDQRSWVSMDAHRLSTYLAKALELVTCIEDPATHSWPGGDWKTVRLL